ncbi:hypothetical protein ACN081_03970 [Rothia sp. P13129]|uniref:hypothetical protein n=1 Tax=Rothia sp. P13129 TaxID=3402664 RepID=UPI003AC9B645
MRNHQYQHTSNGEDDLTIQLIGDDAPTQKLVLDETAQDYGKSVDGNWHISGSPSASADHQIPYLEDNSYSWWLMVRRTIAVLCALCSIVLGAAGGVGYWAEQNIISEQGFSSLASPLGQDSSFQKALSDAVVADIMKDQTVKNYLGEGQEEGFFGSIKNWLRERVKENIQKAAQSVTSQESYQHMWNDIVTRTHRYNVGEEHQNIALDIDPVYEQVNSQLVQFLGDKLSIFHPGEHLIVLDSSHSQTAEYLHQIKHFAQQWKLYCGLSALSLLVGVILWGRNRSIYAGCIFLTLSAISWCSSIFLGTKPLAQADEAVSSEVGKIFVQRFSSIITDSATNYVNSLTIPLMVIGIVLILLGVAFSIVSLGARERTAGVRI